jgi:DNA-binding GntR family transcriptional regulator
VDGLDKPGLARTGVDLVQRSRPVIFPISTTPHKYKALWRGIDIAPAEVCDAFRLPYGSKLRQLSRLRRFEGRPHSVTYNTQLPELGQRHAVKDLNSLPMSEILKRAGVAPGEMVRRAGAANPPVDVAAMLERDGRCDVYFTVSNCV